MSVITKEESGVGLVLLGLGQLEIVGTSLRGYKGDWGDRDENLRYISKNQLHAISKLLTECIKNIDTADLDFDMITVNMCKPGEDFRYEIFFGTATISIGMEIFRLTVDEMAKKAEKGEPFEMGLLDEMGRMILEYGVKLELLIADRLGKSTA